MRSIASKIYQRVTNFTLALILAISTLTGFIPFLLADSASAEGGITISDVTELCDAIDGQADGQAWTIEAGDYGLGQCNIITAQGQTGWYLPITASNLTINGIGNPTIYGSGFTIDGSYNTQNLVTIFGDNVTIDGLTLMPKVQPNKTIEVLGNNFTLKNSTITPNTKVDPLLYDNITNIQDRADLREWGGSIYFSHNGNHLLENVTIVNGGISAGVSTGANVTVVNTALNYTTNVSWINSYRYNSKLTTGGTMIGTPAVTYDVNSTLNNLDSVIAGVQDVDTININSDLTTNHQINITKALTINGNNHSITATSAMPNNSAVIAPTAANGLKISNLTVDGANVTKIHGINAFKSTLELNDVTLKNNTKNGLVVNSSQVTVNNIKTLNNGWGGIDVDQNDASSALPSKLTVNGTSTHSEAGADIYIDDTSKPVSVVDTNTQYNFLHVNSGGTHPNDSAYKLKPVPPVLTVVTPSEGQYVSTKANGNKLKITGSFTDDVKANSATFQLVHNGSSVAIGIIYGYGSTYNPAATYANADGTYSYDLAVPANLTGGEYSLFYTGKDFDGGVTTRMERKLIIDNVNPTAPTITSPGARTWHKITPIVDKWNPVTGDSSGINHYQIAYRYDDGHLFGGDNTCPDVTISDYSGFIGCRDVTATQRNHTPGTDEQGGVTIWVRAIDNAGNVGPWSSLVNYHYDYTAATTTIAVSPLHSGVVGNEFTVGGDASDNLALNRVYVQLIDQSTGTRYGGTTINLIPDGKTGHWVRNYNALNTGLPEGNYYAVATVTDMAGNSTTTPFFEFTVDKTAPILTTVGYVGTNTTPTITGTTNSATDTVTVDGNAATVDPAVNGAGTYNWSYVLPTQSIGTHVFTVVSTDLAGNATSPETVSVTIESTTPATTQNTVTPQAVNNNLGTSAVLGAQTAAPTTDTTTTQTPAADALGTPAVKGASDQLATTTPSSSSTDLAWYWWLAILAALVALWWAITAYRHRGEEV